MTEIRDKYITRKQLRIYTSKPCIKFINCKFEQCNIELVAYKKPNIIIFDDCEMHLCNIIILANEKVVGYWISVLKEGYVHSCRIIRKDFNGVMQAIARIKNKQRYMRFEAKL